MTSPPLGQTVRVHFNKHKRMLAVSVAGRVAYYCAEVILEHARAIVSLAGWRRALREGHRNVHAKLEGRLADAGEGLRSYPWETEMRYDLRRGGFYATPPVAHYLEDRPFEHATRAVVRGTRAWVSGAGCWGKKVAA